MELDSDWGKFTIRITGECAFEASIRTANWASKAKNLWDIQFTVTKQSYWTKGKCTDPWQTNRYGSMHGQLVGSDSYRRTVPEALADYVQAKMIPWLANWADTHQELFIQAAREKLHREIEALNATLETKVQELGAFDVKHPTTA